jgi:hypothetical protein
MEPAGWVLLIVSWLTIGTLAAYCLYRIVHDERQ